MTFWGSYIRCVALEDLQTHIIFANGFCISDGRSLESDTIEAKYMYSNSISNELFSSSVCSFVDKEETLLWNSYLMHASLMVCHPIVALRAFRYPESHTYLGGELGLNYSCEKHLSSHVYDK